MKTSTTYREYVRNFQIKVATKSVGMLLTAMLLTVTSVNAQCTISSTSSTGPTTCSGTTGTITLNGLAATTTYSFHYSKNGVAQTAVNVTTNASGVLVKTALSSGSYSGISVSKAGCTSSTVGPFTLSDPAAPVISSTSSTGPTTCAGANGTITLNGLLASTSYTFNYSKNGIAQTSVAITSNASGQVIKTALTSGTYSNISVTVNNCTSSTVGPITLSDPAAPVISSTSSTGPTTCAGASGTITLNGLLASTSYTFNYTKNGVVQTSVAITSNASGQVIKTALASATYSNISVTINNCTSSTVGPITLSDPTPPTVSASSNSAICQAATLNLTATTITGATYTWAGPGGYTSTTQNPARVNATTAMSGTYSVTAKLNNCSSTPATTSVTVNATPATPTTTSNSPVCTGNSINLTASSATGGVTYSWTGPNTYSSSTQNPTITGVTTAAAGTYSVIATVNGCNSATATRAVVVNTTPAYSSTSSTNPTTCAGTSGTIILNGLNASTTYTFAYYKNGVAQANTNITTSAAGVLTKTALGAGTYSNINVTNTACVSSSTGPITLSDPAAPTITAISNNGPVCQGTTLTMSCTATTGVTYSWSGPGGFTSTSQNPSRANATTAMGGTYSLTVAKSGCTSSVSTTTATVNATPATPTAGSNTPVCSGNNLNLTSTSTTPGVTYSWTGPNTFSSASQNPTITAATTAAAGTYTVHATANGCNSANGTVAVVVNATPVISGNTPTNPTTCGGTTGKIVVTGLTNGSTYTINYNKNGVAATPSNITDAAAGLTIPNLSAGAYTNITATINSCISNTVAGPINLSDPAAPVISSTSSVNPTTCAAANGSFNLNGLLANTTYTVGYNKNGSAVTPVSKTSNASGVISVTLLSAGIYDNITVTRSSCTSSAVGPIDLSGTPVFTTSFSNPVTCSGSNGNIYLNGLIPSSTYTVNYTKNAVAQTPVSLTSNASGVITMASLPSATYASINVTIAGCTSANSGSITLTDPVPPTIASVSSSNPTTCLGNDGSVTLTGLTASTNYTVNYQKSGVAQTSIAATGNGSGNVVVPFAAGSYSNFNVTTANCVSNTIGSVTISDPTPPTITASNNGPLCLNGTLNFTSTPSVGGVTYSWTGPNSFTSTSQNPSISNLPFSDTGTYSVTATINNCTSSAATTTVVINTPTTIPTPSNSGNTCVGLPFTLYATPVNGVTYNWTGPNSYSSTSQNPTISSATSLNTGTYYISATKGGCSTGTDSTSITINPGFSVTLTGATTLCAGLMTNVNLTSGPAGGTVTYKINGGSNLTATLDGSGDATISTGTLGKSLTYKLVSVGNGTCTYTKSDSTVITVNPNTWSGSADSNWSNASNWCGGVPTATTPVLVPTVTRLPVVPTGTTLTNTDLSVASGATVTLEGSSSIVVTGNATINGAVTGGSVIMAGSAPQTISGKGTVANLEITNSAGAAINTGDTLKVAGVITLTTGTLNTNNSLILKSDSTGTASIGTIINGSITGNVTLQQYIPAGKRLYRFFSHPYNTTIALNPELTSQIDITGAGGAANGFTATQTNNPSAYWYNPLTGNTNPGGNGNDPGWTAFTSANATSGANGWKPYEGIRVLVRGAKGEGLNGGTYTPSATTLSVTGIVNTGTINIPIVKGTNSSCNIVGNPYPSAVNLGGVMYNAYQAGLIQGSAYYVWDAEAGTSGAYITQHISGPSDFYNLPSGSAFVVNAATAGNLTFNETDKVATGDNLFRTTSGPANRVEFRIYSNHDSIYWDRMFESFEPNAVNGVDNYDGSKATNPSVNFYSLANDGTHLSIDARPFVNNMVIPIGFRTSMPAQTYKMKIQTYALPADHVLYLVDNYLNTVEQMQLGSEYTFSVTSDTLSQGDNRFQLNAMLLDTTTTTNVATTNIKNSNTLNVAITPNPATVQTSIRIEGAQKGNTSVSIMNVSGVEVFNTNLGEISTQSIIVPLQDLAAGIYMVKVTSGTETMTTRLVKQ